MTDTCLAVVVLAAGEGTRMRSSLAKVLHPLAGLPMIAHVLTTAQQLHPAHLAVVVRHQRDAVAETVTKHAKAVTLVDQDDIPGTGRAVELALQALPKDFAGEVLVVSGDVPLLDSETLSKLIGRHREHAATASVLTATPDDPSGYGRILRDGAGAVQAIVEEKDAHPDVLALSEINSGSYVFQVQALRRSLSKLTTGNAQGEKYLTDVIALLSAEQALVLGILVRDSWRVAGVNDRVQLAEQSARLNALIIRKHQLNGVSVREPASTWIDASVSLRQDVEILPGTHLAGATTVASGAVIGPDTTLTDCEVGEGARVSRTEATLAVIHPGATVGPFAYLRPGTELGERGKIGAFVETKNAHIGTGSKVPHLSYLGDTEVGEGANIGAGTITANYDGVNKHRTRVGARVRTGAHNVFVAPVEIGDDVYTGAGTVVRKDVPPGALALSVAPQRNQAGWVATHRPGASLEQGVREGE